VCVNINCPAITASTSVVCPSDGHYHTAQFGDASVTWATSSTAWLISIILLIFIIASAVCLCNVSLGHLVSCIIHYHTIADGFGRAVGVHDVTSSHNVCGADEIRTRHSLVRTTKGGLPTQHGLCILVSLSLPITCWLGQWERLVSLPLYSNCAQLSHFLPTSIRPCIHFLQTRTKPCTLPEDAALCFPC
jgi:hypothetical protein